jgi:hypothetical protein
MKYTKHIILFALALALSLGVSRAQSPYRLLSTPAFVLAGGAGGTTTNLGLGVTTSTITTNILATWTVATGTAGYTTNYVTNSVTSYPDFDALSQRYVVLQHEWTTDIAGGVSNSIITVARSVNALHFDNQNNITATNASLGTGTNAIALWQIDMGGYPYGRVVGITFSDTSSSHHMTNGALYVSKFAQGSPAASGR